MSRMNFLFRNRYNTGKMSSARSVLIVEDESLIALEISTLLNKMGYPFTSLAADGVEAIHKAREMKPELVLMDISLKGEMDGIEAARQILLEHDVPVIFLTALTDEETIQRASKIEPYAYLVKPFRPYEVETAVAISLYKHASEKRLKESEERYRRLFEEAIDGIAILALDSQVLLDCNPALLQILDQPRENLVGQPLSDLNANCAGLGNALQALADALPRGASPIHQAQVTTRSGEKRAIEITGSLFTLHECPVIQAFFRDITERQRAEEAERRARQQAEALRASMEALVSNLSLEEVLEKILTEFGALLPYDTAAVVLQQDGKLRLATSQGIENPDGFIASCLHPSSPITRQVLGAASPLILSHEELSQGGVYWQQLATTQNLVAIPLQVRGKGMGSLLILNNRTTCYEQTHLNLAQTFANQAAIAIENARLYEEERLAAMTDPLTGLYNRRFFYRMAQAELERGQQNGQFPALVMLDIDYFKRINDTYGHPVGDLVLRYVSNLLSDSVRKGDVVIRFGGEEFAVLLPNTRLEAAHLVAERLRTLVAEAPILSEREQVIRLTLSAGVAISDPDHSDLNGLIRCADQALYQAKQAGRNQVIAWREA